MSIAEIKLVLIKRIAESEDQQQLLQLLQLINEPSNANPVDFQKDDQLLNILLQSSGSNSASTTPTSQQDIDDLQQSINELFSGVRGEE